MSFPIVAIGVVMVVLAAIVTIVVYLMGDKDEGEGE
jgi:hypothetical protein